MFVAALLAGAAVAVALVVAGDDDGTLAADEFQERAGAACSAFYGTVFTEIFGALDPATGDLQPDAEEEVGTRAVELGDDLMSELRMIGAPEGRDDQWNEWIGLMEGSLDERRADPASIAEGLDPERGERITELSQELGVPECSGEEPPQSEETKTAVAGLLADAIRADSDGLITETEAACMGQGFADEFTLSELAEFDETGTEIENLPADRQAAVVEVVTGCLPAEKLIELGS